MYVFIELVYKNVYKSLRVVFFFDNTVQSYQVNSYKNLKMFLKFEVLSACASHRIKAKQFISSYKFSQYSVANNSRQTKMINDVSKVIASLKLYYSPEKFYLVSFLSHLFLLLLTSLINFNFPSRCTTAIKASIPHH